MTQATLDEFEKLLEESFSNSHSVADIVEGTVIRKEQDGYLVSVRGKFQLLKIQLQLKLAMLKNFTY